MKNLIYLASILIIGNNIIACSTVKVPIRVTHPPAIDMSSYKQIAITEISGNMGPSFSDHLKSQLIMGNHYKVVDRNQLDKILGEHNISKDLTDPKARVKAGKFLTASVFISGRADHKYSENITSSESTCKAKNGQKYKCKAFTRTGLIKTDGSVDVVDVTTGQIVATKLINNQCKEWTYEKIKEPAAINQDRLSNKCLQQNVTKIFRVVSPWSETVKIAFIKDKAIPGSESGINMAKAGNMAMAIQEFSKGAQFAESSSSLKPKQKANAYWNLGLANEYQHNFDEANAAFDKAFQYSPQQKFVNEKKHVERTRREQAILTNLKK